MMDAPYECLMKRIKMLMILKGFLSNQIQNLKYRVGTKRMGCIALSKMRKNYKNMKIKKAIISLPTVTCTHSKNIVLQNFEQTDGLLTFREFK